MFWRMTGLSTTSPVDTILEKESFTLEELLDEDEIIQECKALNTRLINFLRERTRIEQLLRYIVEEPPENAEKRQTFKFPFIACEIFTCEVDILLRALVEDGELMDLLFSFLKPDRPHGTLLAGYFSKVVICLMVRKTAPLITYVQGHPEIIHQLVDLIGITSIMEVLIRLIGADENMYTNYMDTVQWLEGVDVLDIIVNKFSSSDSPEVHANAAEILCAITRYAPPGLAAKICSSSFVGRLFHHALEESKPKSVLVHSLSVCISLLDPKRLVASSYQAFRSQLSHGSLVTATQETVDCMLECLGDLLKLLDISSSEDSLPTTYGKLQPPLGKHRLKIVEFISVLLSIGSEAAEKELIHIGAIKCAIDLFFQYPFNNFLHHHVENIVGSCLETKKDLMIEHLLNDCEIVIRILEAENQCTLPSDSVKPTLPAEGKSPPRMGIVGHLTHIANKLIQMGNNSSIIQTYLQGNSEWVDWHSNVLVKRNAVENVYNWGCGRPTSLQDRGRYSDEDDFRDRDYDVAALANNLSQAFRCGVYSNDDAEEAQGSFERDDEDVYFDDESAEVVISSLRLGDDQESSLFTNSNWFAFENDRVTNERLTGSVASSSPNSDETSPNMDETDEAIVGEKDELINPDSLGISSKGRNDPVEGSKEETGTSDSEKPPEWVEWRETTETDVHGSAPTTDVPNGILEPDNDLFVKDEVTSDAENDQPAAGKESPGSDILANSVAESENGPSSANPSESHEAIKSVSSLESSADEAADKKSEHETAVDNSGD